MTNEETKRFAHPTRSHIAKGAHEDREHTWSCVNGDNDVASYICGQCGAEKFESGSWQDDKYVHLPIWYRVPWNTTRKFAHAPECVDRTAQQLDELLAPYPGTTIEIKIPSDGTFDECYSVSWRGKTMTGQYLSEVLRALYVHFYGLETISDADLDQVFALMRGYR